MSRRRVVVTGLGATTPIGGDVTTSWSALLAGTSGVRNLTEEWAQTLPVHFAARVAVDPSEQMERVELRRLDRSEQFAMIASREAWKDAGSPDVDKERAWLRKRRRRSKKRTRGRPRSSWICGRNLPKQSNERRRRSIKTEKIKKRQCQRNSPQV